MSFIVVIPARYASSRLPGKPLLDLAGQTMIERVWRQAKQSQAQQIYIATDDERIAEVARGFGAEVCMTAATHPSGTDRLQEVASQLQLADDAIVVNVQGDEPLLPPSLIDQVAGLLQAHSEADMATLAEPLADLAQWQNPNVVKLVQDQQGRALYFSRAPIPWPRDAALAGTLTSLPAGLPAQRHIGLYAYRVGLLNRFVSWPSSSLEQWECLEQLRVLENGGRIQVAQALQVPPAGIDTAADLQRVRDWLAAQGQPG
ncbi:3-deoxy-manno-octulosonate cytidylyltransferase [Balneatrix alpica]|uniref:3-deoxy-manno-octulosonate cytidylyltransferase n=1 Tax=Balneatrix alpica TaxID=75684 RepID=UPI002739BEF2|nr:3-deoxy-manno-octulosonate cytidylyltransferase [Balneatrix alpica]